MSYWFDESSNIRGSGKQVSFYLDSDTDVNDLPTSTTEGVKQGDDTTLHQVVGKGSSALSIGSGTLFILNSNDEWKRV